MPAVGDQAAVDNARFNASDVDIERVERRVEKSLAKRAGRLVDEFPDRALRVVRDWMAEGH